MSRIIVTTSGKGGVVNYRYGKFGHGLSPVGASSCVSRCGLWPEKLGSAARAGKPASTLLLKFSLGVPVRTSIGERCGTQPGTSQQPKIAPRSR